MDAGDVAIEKNNIELALKEYSAAEEMFPENLEMKYWHAVSLVNVGMLEEALPLFEEVFKADPNWKTLTPRLVPIGLLNVSDQQLKKILQQYDGM
jgi:tetratricopeptide (TPR) repeat protein